MHRASTTQREREGEERHKGNRSHVDAQGVAKKTNEHSSHLGLCSNSRLQSAVCSVEIKAVERRLHPRVHTRGPIEVK